VEEDALVPVRVSIVHTSGKRQHVVTVTGDFDMPISGLVRQRLSSDMHADEVILDLTQVTFMDSTAIGVIVQAHRIFNSGEVKRLRVIGNQPPILVMFEAAGLDHLLEPDRRSHPRA
jgi:anti-sigma B factor antagonist